MDFLLYKENRFANPTAPARTAQQKTTAVRAVWPALALYSRWRRAESHLPLYDSLLGGRRETARAVLEIGIYLGGSIAMWHRYFTQARVFGVDVRVDVPPLLSGGTAAYERMELHMGRDGYAQTTVELLKAQAGTFDFILDDGPHTLDSMVALIINYLPLLSDTGIMIIEDVQDVTWFEVLRATVPFEYKSKIATYDLRSNKGRYDDLVFVIDMAK